jgi:two-component system chemotaxis response regulator CheB
MHTKHLVVIGTSAGGLDALRSLAAALPADFPAAICIVMHTAPQSPGVLHEILGRAGVLPVVSPRNFQRIAAGHIYVAPPDFHLIVEPRRLRITKGPKENRFRPAIDPLFRSAAQVFGPMAIGVVLTGSLDDGTAGLWAIKQLGGTAIVQDPQEALYPSMPQSAIRHVKVDHVVRIAELAPLLVQLTAVHRDAEAAAPSKQLEVEVDIAKEKNAVEAGITEIAQPSSYACPECHGVLLEIKEAGRIRFRCHTGHAYSADSLIAAVGEGVEDALWNAIRALEEASLLMHRMADHFQTSHDAADAQRLEERSAEARRQSNAIRNLVTEREPLTTHS